MARRIAFGFLILLVITGCASSKKSRTRQVDRVIKTARSFRGTPYKWGGTTRAGMDCSGLLINSFASIDYPIPRMSADQSKIGKKVKLKDIRRGDLVFFATGNKRRKITHVGLVTDVRGKEKVMFIHSSSSRGVIETNMYSTYYKKRFIMARRVL
ncbi:MAG: C40 family peptidase [Bacteroidetes bacterium]|nr:C40 family peptidase [Bacteroidota bacterium]MCH8231154.1 C40 family peptidase [Bacteroidota bacterium]